jgi:hypothetical protein
MRALLAAAFAFIVITPAPAADPAPLSGVWVKDADGVDLRFHFLPGGTLKVTVTAGENGIDATAKYTADKAGKVEMTITESKEIGTFPGVPPKGAKFTFTFKADGAKAKLSDFAGDGSERSKDAVEGEYRKVEEKKEK